MREWADGSEALLRAELGARLRGIRQATRKSQQLVADFCGLHQTTLGLYERGVCLPSVILLLRLAAFYGVSLDALVPQVGRAG